MTLLIFFKNIFLISEILKPTYRLQNIHGNFPKHTHIQFYLVIL